MSTVVATHLVDDVAHWRASTKRDELFEPFGITHRTFVEPDSNHVVVILDVPDMDEFEAVMRSDAAEAAMEHDGVRPETMHIYVED